MELKREEELRMKMEEEEKQKQKVEEMKKKFEMEDAKLENSYVQEEAQEHSSLVDPPVPQISEEEQSKLRYQKEMAEANIKDQKLVDGLNYMMEAGYLNFKVNFNLLKRCNNDLVVAINNLCNGIVSDSMLQ